MNKKDFIFYSLILFLLLRQAYKLGYAAGQVDGIFDGFSEFAKWLSSDAEENSTENPHSDPYEHWKSSRWYSADKEREERQSIHAG